MALAMPRALAGWDVNDMDKMTQLKPDYGQNIYDLIDSRVNTINFEIENYDSEFVLKDIPRHMKGSFKWIYFKEKKKEMLFLKRMIELIQDGSDHD